MALFFNKKDRPNFYGLLIEQIDIAAEAMNLLDQFIITRDKELSDQIEAFEKKGDKIRGELVKQVRDSFITPLDRHDLFSLSRNLDDITDEIKDLKDFMTFFSIVPTRSNDQMADCILESVNCLKEAVENLHGGDDDLFWAQIMKAKKNENLIKRLYWQNIKEMEGQEMEPYEMTMHMEFSRDLNSLANKIGKAGDKLGDIKVKVMEQS